MNVSRHACFFLVLASALISGCVADDLPPSDGQSSDGSNGEPSAGLIELIRATVNESGGEADSTTQAISGLLRMSADGSTLAYVSNFTGLAEDDRNSERDVFVFDLNTRTSSRISVDSAGVEGNDESFDPSISNDGQRIVFASSASNLSGGDLNERSDVFLHDRATGETTRLSIPNDESEDDDSSLVPEISGDGRIAAFISKNALGSAVEVANNQDNLFLVNLDNDELQFLSPANVTGTIPTGVSRAIALSDDGNLIAYIARHSEILDFVEQSEFTIVGVASESSDVSGVYLLDVSQKTIRPISVDLSGQLVSAKEPSISGDGNRIAFTSSSTELVPNDTNGREDLFVYHVNSQTISRESLASDGQQHSGFVISHPRISNDGKSIAFCSDALDLVSNDTNNDRDYFLRNIDNETTIRVNLRSDGSESNSSSSINCVVPGLNRDGTLVAFTSIDRNLIPEDNNSEVDVFIRVFD